MKRKQYRGFYEDGRDISEIEYYSDHRNYSKQNMEDMKKEYVKKYGYTSLKYVRFEFGYLIER